LFIRSYGRLQSNRTDVWGLTINDTVQGHSWHEVYICCLVSAIWNPETVWRTLCTWHIEANDNVSFLKILDKCYPTSRMWIFCLLIFKLYAYIWKEVYGIVVVFLLHGFRMFIDLDQFKNCTILNGVWQGAD
jgi:hypothetical protein